MAEGDLNGNSFGHWDKLYVDGFDIVAIDVEFVLLGFGDLNGNSFGHWDLTEELFTQEVSYFEHGTTINNGTVDWEVSVCGSEFVPETKSNTLKRVDLRVRQVGHTYPVFYTC